MPEPNLPPLHLRVHNSQPSDSNMVDVLLLKDQVPESPQEMRQRLQKNYNISLKQAVRLVVISGIMFGGKEISFSCFL